MQKLHKSKTPKVYKNKKLNNANFGTYNLNDYQVFLQLLSKLGKVDTNGTYKQPQDLERIHTITAKEFSTAFGIDLSTAYGVLKRAGKRLADTSLTLQQPELNEIWSIPVCRVSKYNTKEGSLTIEFNDLIMPYLSQIKQKFVLYNLKEVANFGSLYSTRLYELIQEYKDTGYLIRSVKQLRDIFAVGNKFKLYGDFKRKTFAHAVNEINSQYEMNLGFEELKEGRRVVSIRFEFNRSHKAQGYNPATKQMVNITVKPKRKAKQDDDNTPPPVHPDQQELPNINQDKSLVAKVADKAVKALTTPEFYQAIKDDTSLIEGAKKARTRRVEKVKATTAKTIETIEEEVQRLLAQLQELKTNTN